MFLRLHSIYSLLLSSWCLLWFLSLVHKLYTTSVPGSTIRVQHSEHASTSPSSTLSLTRVCPPSIPTLLTSGPTFSAAAVYQLCCRRHRRGNQIAFVGVASPPIDAGGRLAVSASKSSRINRRYERTSIHARTLDSARRVTVVVSCPETCLCCCHPLIEERMDEMFGKRELPVLFQNDDALARSYLSEAGAA